jgi:hypothetical protein
MPDTPYTMSKIQKKRDVDPSLFVLLYLGIVLKDYSCSFLFVMKRYAASTTSAAHPIMM